MIVPIIPLKFLPTHLLNVELKQSEGERIFKIPDNYTYNKQKMHNL